MIVYIGPIASPLSFITIDFKIEILPVQKPVNTTVVKLNLQQFVNMRPESLNQNLVEDGEQEEREETRMPTVTPDRMVSYIYKVKNQEPEIQLSNFMLIIVGPILVVIHTLIAQFIQIPLLQYLFVTTLTAFLINYMGIIRRYELYPYLPETPLDNRLKVSCFVAFAAVMLSMSLGWNGSGGLIFAMFWEVTRGQRMNIYGLYFGAIIVGSLLMEQNYSLSKLWEFLPGILLGWVNSEIFKLKESNVYTIAHQMLFLCCIGFPVFFPVTDMIVPNIWQWAVMIVCGVIMLFTVVIVIKLMQSIRVSVVVGVTAGIMMAGTSHYMYTREYVGVLCIALGVVMLLKMEFTESM